MNLHHFHFHVSPSHAITYNLVEEYFSRVMPSSKAIDKCREDMPSQ